MNMQISSNVFLPNQNILLKNSLENDFCQALYPYSVSSRDNFKSIPTLFFVIEVDKSIKAGTNDKNDLEQ